ncbi:MULTISPECIES: sporulation peptidase YabG [Paenibacillus]|uniref:Sporulation peptidase YabG n=1 Tax=Paenibacillus campinasensis TaxID=66347 RepID=A0A268EGF9_9BACL|nr:MULTISPECIES: sporulation peptidase YabG [Paenibacillus]MUG68783.1 sporulation peptidase YabG [Paenibacillus campinasensis]PAD72218.1 sporulation peptidase YabG [Paenibacillus campinasensis]PAK48747.1 sporulation peptidase YabG [Paenibacillus sp. 7541]
MNLGDLVVRKSYGGDITFRVEDVRRENIIIKGTEFRLLADSPADDLVKAPYPAVSERTKQARIKASESLSRLEKHKQEQSERQLASLRNEWGQNVDKGYFDVPGKVLHLDGDPQYLKKSLALYNQLRVPAEGHYVNESAMADVLYHMLPRVRPDIVVITGHDGVLKRRQPYNLYSLDSYKNSQNFASAIQVARQYERNMDSLIIVAGACQSHFEALLQAGANFASSPGRILIHALDPVYVAAKAAYTSVRDTVNITDIIHHTISGSQGLGGIETRGSYRIGLPRLQDLSTLKVTPTVN